MKLVTPILVTVLAAVPVVAQNIGLKLTHGVDGYLEVPADPALIPGSGLTLEAWITYDDATLQPGWSFPTIVRQNLAAQSESFFLRVEAGQTMNRILRFKVVTATAQQLFVNWPFQPGQLALWTHVACTYDGAMARMYINGFEVGTTPGTGPVRDLGGTLRIGKGDDATSNNEVWNGEIDEVRLWPFARTVGEINATMRSELVGMPGRISTWNLSAFPLDTSGGLHGSMHGTYTWQANSLALRPAGSGGASGFGTSTPGCNGVLSATVGSGAYVGNANFALACTSAPANGNGALLLSTAQLTTPLTLLGVGFFVDPTAVFLSFPASSGVLGAARFPLSLPSDPTIAGLILHNQFLWIDTCGPQGLTASTGIQVTVLP